MKRKTPRPTTTLFEDNGFVTLRGACSRDKNNIVSSSKIVAELSEPDMMEEEDEKMSEGDGLSLHNHALPPLDSKDQKPS